MIDCEIPLERLYAMGRQLQDIKAPIAHQSIVRRGSDSYSVVEEGRVFDGIALEALGAIF